MSDFLNIADFLAPINKSELNFDQGYKEGTIGFNINVHDEENFPDLDEADLVLIGCGEQRGNGHHLGIQRRAGCHTPAILSIILLAPGSEDG